MAHELDRRGEVSQFTDAELVCEVKRLVKADRALTAKLLVHLSELHERKLYAEHGFSSMFEYCRSALGMSEAEAYLRIVVARVGRRFPLALERLGAGAVHLTAIKLLEPHLTTDNHVLLLDRVQGKTKRQIEVLMAELAPKPDVPARMRKLPSARGPRALSNTGATAACHLSSAPQKSSAALMSTAAASAISGSQSDSSSTGPERLSLQAVLAATAPSPISATPAASGLLTRSTGGEGVASQVAFAATAPSPTATASAISGPPSVSTFTTGAQLLDSRAAHAVSGESAPFVARSGAGVIEGADSERSGKGPAPAQSLEQPALSEQGCIGRLGRGALDLRRVGDVEG